MPYRSKEPIATVLFHILCVVVVLTSANKSQAQSGDVVILRITDEIVNQGNVGQIQTDYNNGEKWVAYFSATIAGNGLTFSVDLADYLGITPEGQAG